MKRIIRLLTRPLCWMGWHRWISEWVTITIVGTPVDPPCYMVWCNRCGKVKQ